MQDQPRKRASADIDTDLEPVSKKAKYEHSLVINYYNSDASDPSQTHKVWVVPMEEVKKLLAQHCPTWKKDLASDKKRVTVKEELAITKEERAKYWASCSKYDTTDDLWDWVRACISWSQGEYGFERGVEMPDVTDPTNFDDEVKAQGSMYKRCQIFIWALQSALGDEGIWTPFLDSELTKKAADGEDINSKIGECILYVDLFGADAESDNDNDE